MMALAITPGQPDRARIDDYLVDPGVGQAALPLTYRILAVVNFVLLMVLAGVSFALFWIVATLLGFI